MNRRQRKKQFKKQFGVNPPKNLSIRTATIIMQHRETIIAAFERFKNAILDLWEMIKKPALELAKELKEIAVKALEPEKRKIMQYEAMTDFQTKVRLQMRQQERERLRIEGDFNIHNHDRR